MNRTPLIFRSRDVVMVGTMHVPPAQASADRDRIALLLMNGGPVPRAGSGDLSAYLCDRLAEQGVTGFRFDLQGLGDATGPSWREGDTFWRAAQRGFNDAAVVGLVEDLCRRFELRGVMLGGLCAGGVLSLRAVRGLRQQLLGLVLLEPDLRASAPISRMERFGRLVARLRSFDEVLATPTGSSRYARVFRFIQPWLKWIAGRRTGPKLPPDVQKSTVSRWRRLTCEGVPSVLVVAKDGEIDRYSESVIRTFPPAKRDVVRVVRIPNANHILVAEDSRRMTGDALCAWVAESFPQAVAPRLHAARPHGRDPLASGPDYETAACGALRVNDV